MQQIDQWLRKFDLEGPLHDYTAHVLSSLPQNVRSDLTDDNGVTFYDYDPQPGGTMHVPVRPPGRSASRSIVLKRTLARRPPDFVHWLIAHEIAHAHLRNKGRWPGEDPETAADALAGEWGFPKPTWFNREFFSRAGA